MNFTDRCSEKISKEHFVSQSIIKLLGDPEIGGLPWMQGEAAQFSKISLSSNILCAKHNSELSALDSMALVAISTILASHDYAEKRTLSRRSATAFASYKILELWALKLLLGFLASKQARNAAGGAFEIPQSLIDRTRVAFAGQVPEAPYGMYIDKTPDGTYRHQFEFAVLSSKGSINEAVGLVFRIRNIQMSFLFVLSEWQVQHLMQARYLYRPISLDLVSPGRSVRVWMDWPTSAQNLKAARFEFAAGKKR